MGDRDRERSTSRDNSRKGDRDDSGRRKEGSRDRGRSRSRSRSHSRGRRDRDRSRDRDKEKIEAEVMDLEAKAVAYLLGRNGSTKNRLASFCGCRLEIDPRGDDGGKVEIIGTDKERDLAKLCIDITLQQRNNGRLKIDIGDLESRSDVSMLDVQEDVVGFLLGSKGATLREMELKYKTFMFFDNDQKRGAKKRLYILGKSDARKDAVRECENAIAYKLSGNGSLSSWRERDRGPRYDVNYTRDRSRGRDGGRSGYSDRSYRDSGRSSRRSRSRSRGRR